MFVLSLFLSNLHPGTASAGETRTGLDPGETPTGILYDRVLPLSRIERFDGSEASPPVSLKLWRQIAFEIERASLDESRNPVGKMRGESRRRNSTRQTLSGLSENLCHEHDEPLHYCRHDVPHYGVRPFQ